MIDSNPENHPTINSDNGPGMSISDEFSADIDSLLGKVDSKDYTFTLSLPKEEEDETANKKMGEASRQLRRSHLNFHANNASLARQWPRQVAMVLAALISIVYLVFRVWFTLNLSGPFAALFSLTLFCAETYGIFHLFLYFYQVWRLIEPPTQDVQADQTIDVFVTTYNEDVELLRNTLRACVEMEYPHTTHVLDDGNREEVKELAKELGVEYITRAEHKHAKAGNVNNALEQTEGEFVVILDADHVPHMHMLIRMLGYFNDPEVGFVQAPHTTYNLDNFLGHWSAGSRIYWEDVRIFFEAVQLGKNRHGVACFCGSAAMFRRKALEDVNLLATETITEDLHTGMRINAAGWKSLATREELVVGLAPEDPESFCSQRLRWGEGNLSVLAYDNPLTMKGLKVAGRINYLASILSWTYGPVRLIMYLVPLVMLLTGIPPVDHLTITYGVITAAYLISVWMTIKIISNKYGHLLGIELAMMSSFHLHIHALFRAIFRRRFQKFVVTSKRAQKTTPALRIMWPQAMITLLGIAAVSWATARVTLGLSADYLGLAIGSLLALYHAGLGLTILRQASQTRDPESQWQHPSQLLVEYQCEEGNGHAVSLRFNEDKLTMIGHQALPKGMTLDITIKSAFADTKCMGKICNVKELTDDKSSMYLYTIAFQNPDPAARQAEKDAIAKQSFGYVVPWSIAEQQKQHIWIDQNEHVFKIKEKLPLAIEIHSNGSAKSKQEAVIEEIDHEGLVATLAYPLEENTATETVLHAPSGTIVAKVRVTKVRTFQVGINILHRHRFEWIGSPPDAIPYTLRWLKQQHRRHHDDFSSAKPHTRLISRRNLTWATTCALTILLTAILFWGSHQNDLLLVAATKEPLSPSKIQKVKNINQFGIETKHVTEDRLLRMYEAAIAIEDTQQAAKLASRLADQMPGEHYRWNITAARLWAQNGNHQQADQLFKHIIASGNDKKLSIEERASLYIEIAREAIAVNDIERSVAFFEKSGRLKSFNEAEIDEYIGLLLVANKLPLAFRHLKQMGTEEKILHRIVHIYEMANQAQSAVPVLEELNALNPKDTAVIKRLAELAFLRGELETSINYYRRLQELLPQDPEVRRSLAGVLATQKNPAEAIELLRGAEDQESLLLLASILETTGNYEEALEELHKITGKQVNTSTYQKQLVRLFFANHEYHKAVNLLAQYIEKYPDNWNYKRDFLRAIAAVDINTAGQGKSSAEAEKERTTNRQALEKVYRQYQEISFLNLDAPALAQLAEVLKRYEMSDDAMKVLDFAIDKHPNSREVRLQLAQILADLGRYGEAEKQFTALLENDKQ